MRQTRFAKNLAVLKKAAAVHRVERLKDAIHAHNIVLEQSDSEVQADGQEEAGIRQAVGGGGHGRAARCRCHHPGSGQVL